MLKRPISRRMGEIDLSLAEGVLYRKLACAYFDAAISQVPPVVTL